ncbi:YceI family protein [Pseudoduganella sp. FT93W]|uniref:YceI family protein n=1 Tax=Duganella fentianensis TaxID=2692177 RepID=A0A845I120_9BURK|nr:YceI family protein [Duganella fentianensis]MYN45485.1 YceI family protein [Duganella fentianensis]
MTIKPVSATVQRRSVALLCALVCSLALNACSPVAPLPPAAATPAIGADAGNSSAGTAPAGTAAVADTLAATAELPVLNIDDAASQITIIVRRGGLLARLGHDHLILVRQLSGSVDQRNNRATLQFRLDDMLVDPPELRLAAGLRPQPSADAIAGTRHNMLQRTLDAERYPLVLVQAERHPDGQSLQLALTLHGVTRQLRVPASLQSEGRSFAAEGSFTILQSDYGITPFAIMGGALAVQDQLELHYRLQAR